MTEANCGQKNEQSSVDEPAIHVTDEMVDAVENMVGMGHGAWDMVNPKAIISAAIAVGRATS